MSLLTQFGITPRERVDHAIAALQKGEGIILIDDEHRENEGDLIFSSTHLTLEQMASLIRDCSGIICLCITQEKAAALSLKRMVDNNTSPYQTAFTISIEAREGVTTGVSAHDRLKTIKTASQKNATFDDLRQPGHVFPLIARDGGVLERRGHTEGSIDLMRLANLEPCSVLCELMNADGTMKDLPQLVEYANLHHLTIVSIEDIYQARTAHNASV